MSDSDVGFGTLASAYIPKGTGPGGAVVENGLGGSCPGATSRLGIGRQSEESLLLVLGACS